MQKLAKLVTLYKVIIKIVFRLNILKSIDNNHLTTVSFLIFTELKIAQWNKNIEHPLNHMSQKHPLNKILFKNLKIPNNLMVNFRVFHIVSLQYIHFPILGI